MAKILIVEDAQDQLELFAKTFRRAGFDVYGAHDGGHAMDRVRDVRPDIILLDQMMPEVDGITFLQNLRRFPRWKNTPVVLVTGLTDRMLRTRATSLGVQDILVKGSFQLKELIELVKQRLGDKFQPKQRGQGHNGQPPQGNNGHAQPTPKHPATPDEATSAVA
jgi:DNA-binding response OmpR family regulator